MTVHELKIWPEYFQPLIEGRKTFELRKADRDFKVGDMLHLREYLVDYVWDRSYYTGREAMAEITYILEGPMVLPGMCLMSIVLDSSMCTLNR